MRCKECDYSFQPLGQISPREERYQGRLYEPPTIYCPYCGSDIVEPEPEPSEAQIERAERNACGLWDK